MTILPKVLPNDILASEIESWKGFSEIMRSHDRKLFLQMLDECYQFSSAINSKGELFSTESMLMRIVFAQQKIINELVELSNLQKDKNINVY